MIIDIHGHYTTEPKQFLEFRERQVAGRIDSSARIEISDLGITDDMLVASVAPQLISCLTSAKTNDIKSSKETRGVSILV